MSEEKIIQILRNLLNQKDKWDYKEKSIGKCSKQTISAVSKKGNYECRIISSVCGANSSLVLELYEISFDEVKLKIMEKNLEVHPFFTPKGAYP